LITQKWIPGKRSGSNGLGVARLMGALYHIRYGRCSSRYC
uniref:Pro-adrenomedullin n=1 Tax=Haemonchus placei TaxID=6290 RepID=A0A0N4WQH3_HAEPC